MTKMRLFVITLLILIAGVYGMLRPSPVYSTEKGFASYKSPEGIEFVSLSSSWNEDRLRQLYESFMGNVHGEELALLGKVYLSPEDRGQISAEIDLAYNQNLLGKPTEVLPGRTIMLYSADTVTDMNEMSYLLAHEYGHLFTYYWLIKKEGKLPADPGSEWANIRKLYAYPVQWQKSGRYGDPIWDPGEIMADEYVILLGSKESKAGIFHVNESLPPADEVPGLKEYWLSLTENDSSRLSVGGDILQSLASRIVALLR